MEITIFLFCLEMKCVRKSSLFLRQACFTQTSEWTMQPHKECAALWRSQPQGTANQSWMKGAVSQSFELEQSSTCFPLWQRQFFLIKLQHCQRAWGTGRTHGSGVPLQQGSQQLPGLWEPAGEGSEPCPSLALVALQLELCVLGWLQTGQHGAAEPPRERQAGTGWGHCSREGRREPWGSAAAQVGPASAHNAQGRGRRQQAPGQDYPDMWGSFLPCWWSWRIPNCCVQPTLPSPALGWRPGQSLPTKRIMWSNFILEKKAPLQSHISFNFFSSVKSACVAHVYHKSALLSLSLCLNEVFRPGAIWWERKSNYAPSSCRLQISRSFLCT